MQNIVSHVGIQQVKPEYIIPASPMNTSLSSGYSIQFPANIPRKLVENGPGFWVSAIQGGDPTGVPASRVRPGSVQALEHLEHEFIDGRFLPLGGNCL